MKFLRRIRRQLLTANKFSKYLLYAIGEILLVVIGILIALGVNNSNNQRLENSRVDRFTEKLKVQLQDNLEAVDIYIETNELFYDHSIRLMSILGEKEGPNLDAKIDSLVLFNSFDYHLNLNMNVIMESRENGDLALISKDSLSQSIYYFLTYYNKIVEDERITNSNLNNHFVPYLTQHYNLNNLVHYVSGGQEFHKSKIYAGDNNEMLMDQEFESLITLRLIHAKELLDSYIRLKEIIEETNELL